MKQRQDRNDYCTATTTGLLKAGLRCGGLGDQKLLGGIEGLIGALLCTPRSGGCTRHGTKDWRCMACLDFMPRAFAAPGGLTYPFTKKLRIHGYELSGDRSGLGRGNKVEMYPLLHTYGNI